MQVIIASFIFQQQYVLTFFWIQLFLVALKYMHIDATHVLNVLALQIAMLGPGVIHHQWRTNLVLARYKLMVSFNFTILFADFVC